MKILAVDDDVVFLEILKDVLRDAGYEKVTVATSTDRALSAIAAADTPYDCFLLDIRMPGKDGIFLCQEIRNMIAYTEAPILMLTALTRADYIERAFEAGATDYVCKPLNGLELGTRINIAHTLCVQRRNLTDHSRLIEKLKSEIDESRKFEFGDAFRVENVPGYMTYTDLENRLFKFPAGVYEMDIFALKISQADRLYKTKSPDEFRDIINEVAKHIAVHFAARDFSWTYAGYGTFGCVRIGRSSEEKDGFGEASPGTRWLIDVMKCLPEACQIELLVGRPIRPGLWSGTSAAAALEKALRKADDRCRDDAKQAKLDEFRLDEDRTSNGKVRPTRHCLTSAPVGQI